MHENRLLKRVDRRSIIILALFLIGLYVILPQISGFHSSIKYLTKPDVPYLLISILLSFMTFYEAAISYTLLAIKKLNVGATYFIQLSIMFINGLLPAGIGGLGANYSYLRHKKHTSYEAASVVYANNALGLIGHFSLLILVLILTPKHQIVPSLAGKIYKQLLLVVLVLVVILVAASLIYGKDKLTKFIVRAFAQVKLYRHKPFTILLTLLVQMTITITNVLSLYFATKCVHLDISFSSVFIIYTFGSSIKNATPTPGGLGGYEAGLIAAFSAYNIVFAQSLAAILFFRFANFWIPLTAGFVAFTVAEKKGSFSSAPVKTATSESY